MSIMSNFYFDTDAFRCAAQAFTAEKLPCTLRNAMSLSPVTMMELISQLTILKNDDVRNQISAMRNMVNPNCAPILPRQDVAVALYGFDRELDDRGYTELLCNALNTCICADSPDKIRGDACQVKDVLDRHKKDNAERFTRCVEAYKQKPMSSCEEIKAHFARGLGKGVGIEPDEKLILKLTDTFSAYLEFEEKKLRKAIRHDNYNARVHANDLFDSFQLVYLGNPKLLHFVTCDNGFKEINQSPQSKRVHIVERQKLSDPNKATEILREIAK